MPRFSRLWGTVLAALLVAGLLTVAPASAEPQTYTGHVLLPNPSGQEAGRQAWVASDGELDGVLGDVFEVDPVTVGGSFELEVVSGVASRANLRVAFYDDIEAASVCGIAGPTGTPCGEHAMVYMRAGFDLDFRYEASAPVPTPTPSPLPTLPPPATDEIVIGMHTTISGGAPYPAQSIIDGARLYWEWSEAPDVDGKPVRFKFFDDQGNPSSAVQACRHLLQDGAFLLAGFSTIDEMQACARYADSNNVPYLAPGSTEIGFRDLDSSFLLSMSYAEQAELLWQLIESDERLDPTKVAIVRTDSPNRDDAHQAFLDAAADRGRSLVYDETMPTNPSSNDYNETALELRLAGAQVVYPLIAPVHYLQLTARLGPDYRPWWIGVGNTMGFDDVLETGCGTSNDAISKGLFLSAFPGLDEADVLAPDYHRAYREVHGTDGDHLGLALWGLNRDLHLLLENAGADATRAEFVDATEQASVASGLWPPLEYTPDDHFGAEEAHLLKADCSTQSYTTEALFADGF